MDVQELILSCPSAYPTINIYTVAPLPNEQAITSVSNEVPSFNQNNSATNTEKQWSTTFNRHDIAGDGDCYFNSGNCCMKFLDSDWQSNSVSSKQKYI